MTSRPVTSNKQTFYRHKF